MDGVLENQETRLAGCPGHRLTICRREPVTIFSPLKSSPHTRLFVVRITEMLLRIKDSYDEPHETVCELQRQQNAC